jgi:hypothetical protein
VRELDEGGATFTARIADRLTEIGVVGYGRRRHPDDEGLERLHRTAGEGFADALLAAKDAAVPLVRAGEPVLTREGAGCGAHVGWTTCPRHGNGQRKVTQVGVT